MKFLLVVVCAFSVASADVSHLLAHDSGYSYGGGSSSTSGGSPRFEDAYTDSFGGGSSSHGSAGGAASFGGGSASLQTGHSGYLDYSSGSSGGVSRIVKPVVRHGPAIVSKAFYVHQAPEEEGRNVQVEEREHIVNPRKHYNIVFIKTPLAGGSSVSSNNVNVFPENEEKTIVYVLTGRNDGVNVDDNGEIQLPQPKTPQKPEVVFVKYNNEDDAQRAISDIQSQYNSQQGASVSVIGAGSGAGSSAGSYAGSTGFRAAADKPIRSVRRTGRQSVRVAIPAHIQFQKARQAAQRKQ